MDKDLPAEGLLQKLNAFLDKASRRDDVASVPGHVKHAQLRPRLAETLGQLAAGHARHDDVRDQQLNGAGMSSGLAYSIDTIGSGQHVITLHLQHALGQPSQLGLVLTQ